MRTKSIWLVFVFLYGATLFGGTHLEDTKGKVKPEPQLMPVDDDSGYILQLWIGKPIFNSLNYYDQVYGNTNVYPSLSLTYKLAHIPLTTFGLGLKLSWYSANGHPLLKSGNDYTSDNSSALALKLIPYQIFGMAQVAPFRNRFVVFDFWLGYEEMYYEEVRLLGTAPAATTTPTTTTPTTTTTTTTPDAGSEDEVNSGWNKSVSFGLSVNFLINHFEDQTARALRSTTDLRFIYFAPFIEFTSNLGGGRLFISQQNASSVDFSRTSYGILFMFET